MQYSDFGNRFKEPSGIFQLMEDLDRALSGPNREQMKMLGGGNPALIQPVVEYLRKRMQSLTGRKDHFEKMMGVYDHPEGNLSFRTELASYFSKLTGHDITYENIALSQGSQNAFFQLMNLFGGHSNGRLQKILFPLLPEYIGYESVGIAKDQLIGVPGIPLEISKGIVRYEIDFESVESYLKKETIGMICITRPSNPTGSMITVQECKKLKTLSDHYGVKLAIDGAYGRPFPAMVYEGGRSDSSDYDFYFEPGIISVLSLSKAGLPGVRTGIVIAEKEIISMIGKMNAVMQLSTPTVGPALLKGAFEDGSFVTLCNESVLPYYQKRRSLALEIIDSAISRGLPLKRHESKGAFFLWLTFPEIQDTRILYQRLIEQQVVVVPGHHYYPGLSPDLWRPSYRQSIRISYLSDLDVIESGIETIISVVEGNEK